MQDDKEWPIYVPLGDTPYKQQKSTEMYKAKIDVLGLFWPISLDGGHINKSGGISMSYGIGFWHSVD